MPQVGPIGGTRQRWFAVLGRQELVDFRQHERQFAFGQRVRSTVVVVDGNGFAPIALAPEGGIAQTEVDAAFANAMQLQFINGAWDGVGHLQSVQENAVRECGLLALVSAGGNIPAFCYRRERDLEVRREIPVALIAARHRHYRASAVAAQHVIANPNRYIHMRERMLHVRAREHAAHALHLRHALALAAVFGLRYIGPDFLQLLRWRDLLDQFVFRCECHETHSENGVGAGGEDLDESALIPQPLLPRRRGVVPL